MLNMGVEHNQSLSRGQRVRRLDLLLQQLRKQRLNYSKSKWLLVTGDLERLWKEARYCFLDAGSLAQDQLQELNTLDFSKFTLLGKELPKTRHDRIASSSYRVLDPDSEKQCIKNLDRLIELVERVCELEENGLEIGRSIPASPVQPSAGEGHLRDNRVEDRDLDRLQKQKSVSQVQAADALAISTRAIRGLVKKDKLTKAAKGRIVCDQKFVDQFHARHSPSKQ